MFDWLIHFSVRNRSLVVALAAFTIVYGGLVLSRLPIDIFPDLNRPTVTIMTEAHGMAPEEVETFITFPLETLLNGLPGVERVRSSSGVGLSVIYVEFGWNTDIYRNRQLVGEKITQARQQLPEGINPVMSPISSIMGEILLIGITSDRPEITPTDLRTLADWTIRPQLLTLPGIAQVTSIGGGVKQYQILLSAKKLKQYQLSIREVEQHLSLISQNTTGGFIDLDGQEYLIRNIGAVQDLKDLEDSVLGLHFGVPVKVKDVATVQMGIQVKRGDGSMNAQPAVIMSVQKQPQANTLELTAQVEELIENIRFLLPEGVMINPQLFRQASFIEAAITNIIQALRDGIIFVVLVLIVFLMNMRTTVITLTSIPLSFMLSILVFQFFGLSINTMTLGGLAVAIGEIVDDSIIDVENAFRRLRENRNKKNPDNVFAVVYRSSLEIRSSIVFATIIVVLVFIPLFFLSGIEGRLFVPLGVAYIVSIIASLFVALTVTPALCAILLTNRNLTEKKESWLVAQLKSFDRGLLNQTLNYPLTIISISLFLFVLAAASIPFLGREFLPEFNEGTATVNLIARPGTSLTASNDLGQRAERLLLQIPEVKSVARRTGRAELDEHAEGVHYSEIDVDFYGEGRPRPEVLNEVRDQLDTIDGVFISVGQPISHRLDHLLSGVRAQIAIKVFGPELSALRRTAQEIYRSLEGTPGLVDLQVEQQVLIPQVKIHLMRQEAAQYGIPLGELSSLLEKALNGKVVAKMIDGQRIFDIFMRFDDSSRSDLDTIRQTLIKIMPDGQRVHLNDVADVYDSSGPNLIQRENAQRRIIVQANASGRDLDSLVREVESRIGDSVKLPEGYFVQLGGQFESQRQASRMIAWLGLISLLGIFLVLYAHFKSSFIALQIMLSIPLALIGSVAAIYLTNQTLSVASLVAFITLCGISARNGIMMISHYLHLMRYEGEKFSREMIIRGSLERLIPVLMTSLTAMLALIPLAISVGDPGKEILQPLAVVILGGLMSSTLLDMVVTPAVFYRFGRRSAEKSLRAAEEVNFGR